MYKTFVDTWFSDVWPLLAAAINETRAAYRLDPADSWWSLFAGHDCVLSVVPRVFDAPVASVPDTMRHFGFLVPRGAPAGEAAGFPSGEGPAVLVGLSTTYQHQERLLSTIVDALGEMPVRALVTTASQVDLTTLRPAPNVAVAEFVPHALVMHDTDVMVTHGGLGSVASALDSGVPLVCTPIGRDQHLNAERVAALGAGVTLGDEPPVDEIVIAVNEVLSVPSYRRAAQSVAAASRAEGGPPAAAADLETLASGR